ncbi:unnamed protein product, partial [Laminaria digitata]
SSDGNSTGKAVPEVTKTKKRQVVPSLAEVASSVELLGRLTLPDDRAHPVSSNLARARASELATAEAAADAAHAAKTDRAYNIIQLKDRPRIASLPFPSSVDPSEAAQQLTRSVKASLSDILLFCDERFEGLDSAEWVPGWERPLQRAF